MDLVCYLRSKISKDLLDLLLGPCKQQPQCLMKVCKGSWSASPRDSQTSFEIGAILGSFPSDFLSPIVRLFLIGQSYDRCDMDDLENSRILAASTGPIRE